MTVLTLVSEPASEIVAVDLGSRLYEAFLAGRSANNALSLRPRLAVVSPSPKPTVNIRRRDHRKAASTSLSTMKFRSEGRLMAPADETQVVVFRTASRLTSLNHGLTL